MVDNAVDTFEVCLSSTAEPEQMTKTNEQMSNDETQVQYSEPQSPPQMRRVGRNVGNEAWTLVIQEPGEG